jgi:hypothetical protein
MTARAAIADLAEHAPDHAMDDPGEIAAFYDRCSDLMRELLDELATAPNRPRIFPAIEDSMGWPRRRIASVLGGVCHLRTMAFGGRRPYHFMEPRGSAERRWEMWMDSGQARVVLAERRNALDHPKAVP